MKEKAQYVLDVARDAGAEYADVRIVDSQTEHIVVKNGQLDVARYSQNRGYGIRTLVNGAWGFAAGTDFDKKQMDVISRQSVAIAQAAATVNRQKVSLAAKPMRVDHWKGLCQTDPRTISLAEKIDYLVQCDELMQKVKGVSIREGKMHFEWIHKWYADSDGSWIEQRYPVSGISIQAAAISANDYQVRTYPNSMDGQYEGRGYEIISVWKPQDHAERIAKEAVALLNTPLAPEGRMTVIIDSSQLALQIHESCGHAVELDRVLGSEINDYGTSFLTADKRDTFRYGSEIVNIVADPTHPGGLGSFAYDDEGVPAKKDYIVQHGLFKNYLMSRESASEIGLHESNASMRAEDYNRIPLIRMTNVNLLPGESSLSQMIAETDEGIYMAYNKSFSIDDRRWQFQFGTEIGWYIKNGKIQHMVKNPVYSGTTPQFWRSCDAIANETEWVLWGVPNCGKGQPDQTAKVSHGCSSARFRNIQVGRTRG